MKPILYVMVGIPGSGKSTFAHKYLNGKYISRDEIRLSLLKDEDEYFSKEDKVFSEYIKQINESLSSGHDTIADATHISIYSRAKLLRALKAEYKIVFVVINTPFDICEERQKERTGRAQVPKDILKRMYKAYSIPTRKEFEHCKGVWIINDF